MSDWPSWNRESDTERILEVNASALALTGLTLGVIVNRRWLLLPAVVLPFLLQHGIQGWCPPIAVLRRMGSGPVRRSTLSAMRSRPSAATSGTPPTAQASRSSRQGTAGRASIDRSPPPDAGSGL
jgi:hypothetical protein